jgi:hypothetical protein
MLRSLLGHILACYAFLERYPNSILQLRPKHLCCFIFNYTSILVVGNNSKGKQASKSETVETFCALCDNQSAISHSLCRPCCCCARVMLTSACSPYYTIATIRTNSPRRTTGSSINPEIQIATMSERSLARCKLLLLIAAGISLACSMTRKRTPH